MDLMHHSKDQAESAGLRLVPESKGALELPLVEKQFVNFMFFRVDPDWRKLDHEPKSIFTGSTQRRT